MKRPQRASALIWGIVGLFFVCVAGVAVWLIHRIDAEAQRSARQQAEAVARSAEAVLNRQFIAIDLALAGLQRMPGLFVDDGRVLDEGKAPALLRSLIDQNLLVRNLTVLDEQGGVEVSADETTARLGAGLPAGFVDAILRQPAPQLAVSVPVTSFSTGEKVIFLARPLGAPGQPRHVVLATVPVSALTTRMAPAVEIPGLSVALETDEGVLLASVPANDSLLGRRHSTPPAVHSESSAVRLAPGRLSEALTYAAVRPTVYASMVVTAGISDAAVQAASQEARLTTLSIAALFVGVAIGVGALAQAALARLTAATAETLAAKGVLEEALASMDEGFLLWDADGRVVSWNQRYLELFPHMREVIARGAGMEAMAQTAARVMVPDGDERARQAWVRQAMSRYQSAGQEIEQRLPNGQVISAVDRRTATGGIVSIYRDVTEQRTAADELERARRAAEAASEAKTRFLATMSHEIRTPLNGVLGMNGLLLHTALDPRQRMYAETIRASGEALLSIINDILDMSKLEAGRMEVELSDFGPARLVDEVVSLLQARAVGKGISLRIEHDAAMPAVLHGDAGRSRQVLFNLVGNAIKFTEHGSVVVRSAHQPRPDGRVDWTISVRDTGIGIAPEAIPTLFERFVQADNSTSRRFGGSGLGLAISRELVELMGGRIEVASRVGEGSEFRVTLPLARASTEATARAEPVGREHEPSRLPAGLRVLVAEDNRVNQMLLEAILEQMGHSAVVVSNGREAVHQVQQADYDLVLMDIQMPEMDGVSAARAIRQLPGPVGRVPIISVSANVLPEQRAAYIEAGMSDHVAKPIDTAQLSAAIAGVVGTAA